MRPRARVPVRRPRGSRNHRERKARRSLNRRLSGVSPWKGNTARPRHGPTTNNGRRPAEEVAAAARWLRSDAAAYVTAAVLPVDGGMTL
jgi:NAD(P)-dependent dehydrogenase (short-subunit alcohol dehydrogenase family)